MAAAARVPDARELHLPLALIQAFLLRAIHGKKRLVASGAKACAPNDPSPPKLETAAVNLCDDNPPSGP
jgi:hypothetical protein